MTAATPILSKPDLRPAGADDGAFLWTLYRSTRLDEVRAWGWPEAQVDAFLQMQWQTEQRARPTQFPAAEHTIVLHEGRPIGRLLVDRDAERIHVVDIALVPAARGAGVGTHLLSALLDEARERALPLTLSVARGNRAEGLYRRLGFVVADETEISVTMIYNAPLRRA